MSEISVRGAGRPRGGATDATMLIWKVIAANPGITRQGIWEQIEHDIPPGYAVRRYMNARKAEPNGDGSAFLARARRYLLSDVLHTLRKLGTVEPEGQGLDRRFTALRQPAYHGNAEAVDVGGTKAAEHMAIADALRVAEKWLARAEPDRVDRHGRRSVILGPPSRKEYEALVLVVKALRAKGSA